MTSRRNRLWALVGLCGLAAGGVRCDCDTAHNPECEVAADCQELPWVLQCDGDWSCIDQQCEAICSHDCTTASDCDDLDWTVDCQGHWECPNGECSPACDECVEAVDCDGMTWPINCVGHWECQAGACVPVCDSPECTEAIDCGEPSGCEGNGGWFECVAGACVEVCCDTAADCADWSWPEACAGHWRCDRTDCAAVCDPTGCGDDSCDGPGGETEDSCPADCTPPCQAAADCRDRDWNVPCQGFWACELDGSCREVCDYTSCGDGDCAAAEGPNACPPDCITPAGRCGQPSHCLGLAWSQPCEGYWNCAVGTWMCLPQCGGTCGSGLCEPQGGEDGLSCPTDCRAGACPRGVVDCLALPWDGEMGSACAGEGRWACDADPTNPTCDRVCGDSCGDGMCSPYSGESPESCAADCADYDCATADDCAGLPSLLNCPTAHWNCYHRTCWESC